jgi:uncharacterized protein (TIGR03067 family)
MKTLRFLLFLAMAGVLVRAAQGQDAKKELDKLQGTWESVKLIFDGKDLTDKEQYKFKLVFKGDQATVVSSAAVEKEYAKLTFKLDPSTMPKILDVTVAGGVQKNAVLEGIYEVKGDELKLCAKVFGNDRPSEFASPSGSSIVLAVLKKEKP